MRWWVAMPLAVTASVAGAATDLRVEGALRSVFAAVFAAGCLVAVLAVAGTGLVAAMVEPPVVAVLAVAVGTLFTGGPGGGSASMLAIATRLTAAFPIVAAVTGATVLIGLVRLWRRRAPRVGAVR